MNLLEIDDRAGSLNLIIIGLENSIQTIVKKIKKMIGTMEFG